MFVPTGFVNQAGLQEAVAEAIKALDPREVRDIRFSVGEDTSGDPAIAFSVLLTTYASHDSRLARVTQRIRTFLIDSLEPYDQWGLLPYFYFTSDQANFRKNDWV